MAANGRDESRRSRTGGRRGRMARKDAERGGFEQLDWQQPRMLYPPVPVVSEDELEQIHQASLTVLEDIGIEFLNPEARDILKTAGIDVPADDDRIRLDRGLVEQCIASAPSQYTPVV